MSKGTPEQYLEMFLSEQIMPKEWYEILSERPDVKELYQKHLENKNVEYRNFRSGGLSSVTLERNGSTGITEDYLRVQVSGPEGMSREKLHRGVLRGKGKDLHVVFDN